jgi:hypothetical protein
MFILSLEQIKIRAKQFLTGSKGMGDRGRGWGEREGAGGKGGVMTQSLYVHMNKGNLKKRL